MSDEKKEEKPKLDFTKKAKDEDGGEGKYISGDVTITVTKEEVDSPDGFFKRTHKPNPAPVTFSGAFSNDDEKIGNGTTTLTDVKEAAFYFWEKEETNPLFLEVSVQDSEKPQYYYRYRRGEIHGSYTTKWTYNNKTNIELPERLDDRNCGVNRAIVYDLTKPYTTSDSAESSTDGVTKSDCRSNTRTITKSSQEPITPLGGNYTIKEYNVGGQETRISRVTFGRASTTGINPPLEATSKIRVYYWAHGTKEKIPLLIEFKPQASGIQSTWFENTSQKNTDWKSVTDDTRNFYDADGTQPQQELTTKLDEVNCNVNHVVQINVTEQPNNTYCHDHAHDGHDTKKRISVKDASGTYATGLPTYKVYEHIPNSAASWEGSVPYKFIVSKFNSKGGNELNGIITSKPYIPDVTKVLVYFCGSSTDDPLLIYYEQKTSDEETPSTTHHWYKKSGNTWETVPDLHNTVDPAQSVSYPKILDELDKIGNKCQPPKVTIDIKEGPGKANPSTYDTTDSSCAGKGEISVTEDSVEKASNYKVFTHTVQGNTRSFFTVQSVTYDIHSISKIPTPIEKVKDVKVYYWGPLKSSGNPLLIKIEKLASTGETETLWYENKSQNANNDNWQEITEPYKSKLDEPENLLKKLILLNCRLNNVTEIDIGKKPTDEPYCHDKDNTIEESHEQKLIKVEDVTGTEPYDGKKLGSFVVYSHGLSNEARQKSHLGTNFHISKFKKDSQLINLGEPSPPFLYVSEVLVFWCGSGPDGSPLLVHFKHSSTPSETEKEEWYKKDGETDWKEVSGIEIPKSETDTDSIYEILNGYKTKCKSWVKEIVITTVSVAGGSGVIGGVSYATYWYFFLRDPWWRLM